MSQPKWKFVKNLGDASPVDHGGVFVYKDETGVYPEEMEVLTLNEENDREEDEDTEEDENGFEYDNRKWEVRRIMLEKCTFINGVLSDNKFHPDHPAWFADDLKSVASFLGHTVKECRRMLCSDDPCERAMIYKGLADYHGYDNFDSYPLTLDGEAEVTARYTDGELG